jgi:hypothetical protein
MQTREMSHVKVKLSQAGEDVRLRLQPIWQVVEPILFWEEILFLK